MRTVIPVVFTFVCLVNTQLPPDIDNQERVFEGLVHQGAESFNGQRIRVEGFDLLQRRGIRNRRNAVFPGFSRESGVSRDLNQPKKDLFAVLRRSFPKFVKLQTETDFRDSPLKLRLPTAPSTAASTERSLTRVTQNFGNEEYLKNVFKKVAMKDQNLKTRQGSDFVSESLESTSINPTLNPDDTTTTVEVKVTEDRAFDSVDVEVDINTTVKEQDHPTTRIFSTSAEQDFVKERMKDLFSRKGEPILIPEELPEDVFANPDPTSSVEVSRIFELFTSRLPGPDYQDFQNRETASVRTIPSKEGSLLQDFLPTGIMSEDSGSLQDVSELPASGDDELPEDQPLARISTAGSFSGDFEPPEEDEARINGSENLEEPSPRARIAAGSEDSDLSDLQEFDDPNQDVREPVLDEKPELKVQVESQQATTQGFDPATSQATDPATIEAIDPATTDDLTSATPDDPTPATTDDLTSATPNDPTPATTEVADPATTDDLTSATPDDPTPATTEVADPATTDDPSTTTESSDPAEAVDSRIPDDHNSNRARSKDFDPTEAEASDLDTRHETNSSTTENPAPANFFIVQDPAEIDDLDPSNKTVDSVPRVEVIVNETNETDAEETKVPGFSVSPVPEHNETLVASVKVNVMTSPTLLQEEDVLARKVSPKLDQPKTVPFSRDAAVDFLYKYCTAIIGGILGIVTVAALCYAFYTYRRRSRRIETKHGVYDWNAHNADRKASVTLRAAETPRPVLLDESELYASPVCVVDTQKLTSPPPPAPPLPKY